MKALRNETQAQIHIGTKDRPVIASESDELVQIAGQEAQVALALRKICEKLRTHPAKPKVCSQPKGQVNPWSCCCAQHRNMLSLSALPCMVPSTDAPCGRTHAWRSPERFLLPASQPYVTVSNPAAASVALNLCLCCSRRQSRSMRPPRWVASMAQAWPCARPLSAMGWRWPGWTPWLTHRGVWQRAPAGASATACTCRTPACWPRYMQLHQSACQPAVHIIQSRASHQL